uniref:aminoglycoside phosphotransferase family protein n=1 Tax=Gordonia sp. B7-2 TaxID=3420932 RepID=UPI003D8BC2CA
MNQIDAILDANSARECAHLINAIGLDPTDARARRINSGVWNNTVVEIEIHDLLFYFKKYHPFEGISQYAPPPISPRNRARVAQVAQNVAAACLKPDESGRSLTPAILAATPTAFLMAAVIDSTELMTHLRSGLCPTTVVSELAPALARFHSARQENSSAEILARAAEFRNYKLDLQYYSQSLRLDPTRAEIVRKSADAYRLKQHALVHGDLNTKNILVAANGSLGVIDFEQSHLGSPAYDLAFILSELVIFSRNFPIRKNAELSRDFVDCYLTTINSSDSFEFAVDATIHLAVQILYRFNGPSAPVWTGYVRRDVVQPTLNAALSLLTIDPLPVNQALGSILP